MTTAKLKLFAERNIRMSRLNRPYYLYTYSETDGMFKPDQEIHQLKFASGKLYLDNIPLLKARIAPNSVSWNQKTSQHHTMGYIGFNPDGLMGYGNISHGPALDSAAHHAVIACALPPYAYTTQISQAPQVSGTDPNTLPADAWQPSLQLEFRFDNDLMQSMPKPAIYIDGKEVSCNLRLLMTPDHHLEIAFTQDEGCENSLIKEAGVKITGKIIVSPTGNGFSGELCAVSQGAGNPAKTYLWKGLAQAESVPLKATAAAVQVTESALLVDPTLTVTELVTLLPDDDVTQLSHSMLAENMKWAIAQDQATKPWLTDFFRETPPVLNVTRMTLINQSMPWYKTDFALGYLTKGMGTTDTPTTMQIGLTADQQAKLDYHLSTAYSQDKDYNAQSIGVNASAYIQTFLRLQDYINDGGIKWAQAVLDYYMKPSNLMSTMIRIKATADMTLVNNQISLLTALDSSGDIAQQYQTNLLGRLTLQTGILETTITDEDATLNWLSDTLQYINDSFDQGVTPTATAATSVGQVSPTPDFAASVQDLKDVIKYYGTAANAAKAIFNAFALYKGTTINGQISGAMDAFKQSCPVGAGAVKLFTFLAWVGGVFNTAVAYMNWNSQGDTKKAGVIVKTVDLVVSFAKMGLDLLNPLVSGSQAALQAAISESSRLTSVVEDVVSSCIEGEITTNEAIWRLDAVVSGLKMANAEAKSLETPAFWEKVFAKAGVMVKIFTVLITAATLVLNVIDFVRDIKDGKPLQQTIFDGITMALTLGTLVIQIVDLVITSVVCTVLSAAFALLGIIATIVYMFLPTPTTPTPVQTFGADHALPYLANLPEPPPKTTSRVGLALLLPKVELVYNATPA